MKLHKLLMVCIVLLTVLSLYPIYIKSKSFIPDTECTLAVRWEGLYKDKNFRDVGKSINQCYHQNIMREGVFFRSNGWFSGWNCNKVGNPDKIISMNFDPAVNKMFYCWDYDKHTANVGLVPTFESKLDSMEIMTRWQDDNMRKHFCTSLKSIISNISADKKTLIHCNAGRDRTGFAAALLTAITAEYNNMLTQEMLTAIECDYRKTESLGQHKYGHMENFIKEIKRESDLISFIGAQCRIGSSELKKTAEILTAKQVN